jgi:phosphoribosyl 1,2-cyclic phosphate phosphodiesterase
MEDEKSQIELTVLGSGTSQGVPVIACDCAVCLSNDSKDKRLRSSVIFSRNGRNVAIDAGPDFRQQMLRAKVETLDAVVFTHEHKDHTAGLDDVRAYNFKQGIDMPIYGDENVSATLRRDFHYAFREIKYPGVPQLDFRHIEGQFEIGGMNFTPIQVWHHKLPVFGFRVGDITYITDANRIEDSEIEKMAGSKVLIINALRKEKHISHFNIEEAIEMAKRVGAEKTYFTHISHLLGKHEQIMNELPQGIELAFDGLQVTA